MTAGRKRLRVSAFAKVNLDLRVLARRPDGYHELRTTFQSIALADTLTFTRSAGAFRIVCSDPACPTDERNLVWRAAALVWKAAGRRGGPKGVTVRIDKRVPMQAGLGGGSSDAAAALRALATWWRVRIAPDELRRLAGTIGADVPYFLEGGTALGFNRGDVLVPLDDIARAWVVLIVPDFGVSTRDAFGWWDLKHAGHNGQEGQDGQERQDGQDGQERQARKERPRRRVLTARPPNISNDLEMVVAARHPLIRRLTRELKREGASHASLSGSGSAVFGLFSSRRAAERAAAALTGGRIIVTRTLRRAECGKLAAT